MTVLAGFTPTEAGLLVVDAARAEAQRRRSPLLILNSATGSACADRGLATAADLHRLREHVAEAGIDAEVRQITQAVTASESLIHTAEEISAEIVVIGLRQRTRTGKFLMGSVAQDVLLHAPCDVLALRLPF
ncbi:hypothetical protein BH708_16170 [Brachybacterium sp. P6-10-X1]|uniref:universal stress protein n=1 Tax=Brachybacterium sp. P6-10-X1 TaxID=1903186 RepID=UPI0009717A7B|nr:universal stress protein [Brachybacterium sp. P6-10-X1]APX33991.1 hypothetical protein BH708_16170 [Brachybacterium sp. P6-10-X1]